MICNSHQRVLPVPATRVGPLLDGVAEPGNPLWPTPNWPPMVLDRPLAVGADGGHGRIRYSCTAYQTGRRAEFAFGPRTPFDGWHAFDILDLGPDRCLVRHIVVARPRNLTGRLAWALVIRWCHDAVIEELLDRTATAVGHPPATPARWSVWVRLLHGFLYRRPAAQPMATRTPAHH
ncbi:SRPBCC family protein [Nocardia stercoris]|uniref:SRPBCC family protein n=1 Tax=Nocardia stercoris TaxID=2483361 RepID=A0A3M2L3A4_9NOCA|nr:SRPBCC family protein [Nocardia stercoris]RMI30345.1 SRPBCC family protein [Nocardia stercoris]